MVKPLTLEVFIPSDKCACHYSYFTEKVFRAIEPHKDMVDVEGKWLNSREAVKYGIKDLAVVVNKETILPANFEEEELRFNFDHFQITKKTSYISHYKSHKRRMLWLTRIILF